jgi:hypothetical protein
MEPPPVDLMQLWINVMRTRMVVEESDGSSTHKSVPASFVSATDSDVSAQPFEDASIAYDPATYSLSADTRIKQ